MLSQDIIRRMTLTVRRNDVTLATLLRAVQAEKTDDVGIVNVEELPGIGPVDADFVDLCRVFSEILVSKTYQLMPWVRRRNSRSSP